MIFEYNKNKEVPTSSFLLAERQEVLEYVMEVLMNDLHLEAKLNGLKEDQLYNPSPNMKHFKLEIIIGDTPYVNDEGKEVIKISLNYKLEDK